MENTSAAHESALADLISLWQRRRAEGQAATPAELCRDRPDLLPELERRIAALERMGDLVETVSVPTTDTSTPCLPGPVPVVGRLALPGFEIQSMLGRGGMGIVYLARDTQLKRQVALKMVLAGAQSSEGSLGRFRAEAEAVARLQHPHAVQVFSWGEHDGLPYLVMEYVAGGGLDRRIAGRPQSPADAARLVMLLARAVHAAHKAGIVHRDLKPANVLLAPAADEPALNTAYGWPKISDFGLARLSGGTGGQTASCDVLGTPSYMAPEQAAGKTREVGPPADIYALGAILYELLTGCPPFKGESLLETLDQVRSRPPRPPRELCADVPPALEEVCLRCLAKAPADRYPTAADLADDLRRFQDGDQTLAAAPAPERTSIPSPKGRTARRGVLAGLLAVAVIATIGLVRWHGWGKPAEDQPVPAGEAEAPRREPLKGWLDVLVRKQNPAGALRAHKPWLRLHQRGALPLRANDQVRIEVELNRPAFLYVVWLDSAGKVTPVYPWKDEDWRKRPAGESAQRRLDEKGRGFLEGALGPSPSGVETMLLLAREEPLPPGADEHLSDLFSGLPRQNKLLDPRAAAWFRNGEFVRDEDDRGAIQIGRGSAADDPIVRTQELLRGRLRELFSYTRAVCYGFQGE